MRNTRGAFTGERQQPRAMRTSEPVVVGLDQPGDLAAQPVHLTRYCGTPGFGSSFCRSQRTCVSTVRVDGVSW
jgi:hypothetical protein